MAALGLRYDAGDKVLLEPPVEFHGSPSRVIAISATATDRFPVRARRGGLGYTSRYDVEGYSYVGPRSARNIISRSNSMSELVAGLLRSPWLFNDRIDVFRNILSLIGAPDSFSIDLAVRGGATHSNGRAKSFSDYLSKLCAASDAKSPRAKAGHAAYVAEVALTRSDQGVLIALLDEWLSAAALKRSPMTSPYGPQFMINVEFDAAAGSVSSPIPSQALWLAIETGFITIRRLRSGEKTEDVFSAGQWAVFSSILSLLVVASDRSLVLIDEPENGLHPGWQRKYINLVMESLAHVSDCSVVVATHSPLIVGAAPHGATAVVALQKSWGSRVNAELKESPEGWDANAILDEMFGVEAPR